MKKRFLALVLAAAFLLSACSGTNNGDNYTTTSSAELTDVTTGKVNAVEEQPENSSTTSASEESESGETVTETEEKTPDGFPAPYPAALVDDNVQLGEFKNIITAAETANSVLYGKHTLIPLIGEEKNGYRLISPDYAKNTDQLITRMYEGFKYSFWEDTYGEEIENMLPRLVTETDEGVMLSVGDTNEPVVIEIQSAVITELSEYEAAVTALGQQGDKYVWRSYDMLNGVRGWVVRGYEDDFVTGEIAVFSQLLIDKRITLDKIFGNAEAVRDENGDWNVQLVTIDNDIYGHGFYNGLEVEPFMTIEEMRQFMRDTFTGETAESYIRLYINRSYVEKDGHLYLIDGAVLPQTGEFSLANYENRSISSFDVTSNVEWSDGENVYTVPITIAYEDGLWKLDTRLPMRADRIVGR